MLDNILRRRISLLDGNRILRVRRAVIVDKDQHGASLDGNLADQAIMRGPIPQHPAAAMKIHHHRQYAAVAMRPHHAHADCPVGPTGNTLS